MSACCIGGVCIPYSALLPLLYLLLKYLTYPLIKLGILPPSIARRIGIQVPATKEEIQNNQALNKTCCKNTAESSCSASSTTNDDDKTNGNIASANKNNNNDNNNTHQTAFGKVTSMQSVEEYRQFATQYPNHIIKFTATWCKPCKEIQPYYESLASSNSSTNVAFCTIDVDELDEIAAECQVAMMPTFVTFRNGVKVDSISGKNEDRLKKLIDNVYGN
mmetsp:Transcript_11653/g.16504  ORF Transcript_11653/g.16504 Transcript_11653/m.16504 type:complete len:219 (+) Transcript_11653:169-825(+)